MISTNVSENKENLMKAFHNTSDLVAYEFETNAGIKILISYIEGFIDSKTLDNNILNSLILNLKDVKDIKKVVYSSTLEEVYSMSDIIDVLPRGRVGIFLEGNFIAYTVELSQWDKRAVEQPETESVVRGPKEGFIEDISVNKVLIRRVLRNNSLVYEDYQLGKQTKTTVTLAYIEGIVNENVLEEVKKRVQKIDMGAILESNYIEELIEDKSPSFFSTMENSEKPDVVASKILEGRVAILIDGTPHVLTVPRLFVEGLMTSEEYYESFYYGSMLRFTSYIALLVAVYLPGFFVALQLYHQEMIPTPLLISAAGARQGVPLPAVVEVFLMAIAIELTKESGVRLPKSVGNTVSIVGALILGQAAVAAGLVNGLTVIIIASAAVAEYILPKLTQGIVMLRFAMILLGGVSGLYGIACGFMITTTYILSMDSFGVPYGWPIAPRNWQGLKQDTFIRAPMIKMIFRPQAIVTKNIKRQVPPKGH